MLNIYVCLLFYAQLLHIDNLRFGKMIIIHLEYNFYILISNALCRY